MNPTIEPRPTIVAILGCNDHGPCDPEPSANCPHCGAGGRYVFIALMSDGSRKGMMRGCLKTFRRDWVADECEKALAKRNENRASRWDWQILNQLELLDTDHSTLDQLRVVCQKVKAEKRAWMMKKGYLRR